MEHIKTLLARYSQTAFLFFMGLILIVYLALGILYLQQAPQQKDLQTKIDKLNAILKNPLPSISALNTEIAAIDKALAPMADNITIAMLVSLAEKNGIDITEGSGKLQVPVASHSEAGSYRLVTFRGVHVQGDLDKVMAFIRVLDSDEKLETLESNEPRIVTRVVSRIVTEDVEVLKTGAEAAQSVEWHSIQEAVMTMMKDNNLISSGIPNPVTKPTNYMGDNPNTPDFEGFPDIITTVAGKGYTGNATPKQGYVLYEHDKISTANTTLYSTTNYTQKLTTTYYYTVDNDGKVHAFDSPIKSKEYLASSPTKMELKATLDVGIYFSKPK